jgi:hypothetical protein
VSEFTWYKRFGDVPGVAYQSPRPVRQLKFAGARPKIETFKLDGRTITSTLWPSEEGGETSASPAAQHGIDPKGVTSERVLANLREALELPGTVSDYHFALQGAADALWPRRRDDPALIEIVVDLSHLDVQLVAAHPEAISDEFAKEKSYYAADAFRRLTDIYLREGLPRAALEVARLGRRFDQAIDVDEIESCIAAIDGELQR